MSGYDPDFLGKDFKIPLPGFAYDVEDDVLRRDDLREGYIRDYLHYSLVMSRSKRQALYSIANLDQKAKQKVSGSQGRRWFVDPKIGSKNQMDNRYYKGKENLWDRGHLTRRTAVTWGDSFHEALRASNDSCSYANASLQHRNFNEDEWRVPEKLVANFDRDQNGKIIIITGPLFTEYDRWFTPRDYDVEPGRIPSGFWKIIAYIDKKKSKHNNKPTLGCEAYRVYQDRCSIEDKYGADKINLTTLQVTISELQDLTGLQFCRELYEANVLYYHATEERGITEPERYRIKDARRKSDEVREGWPGHVIHDREDIKKHGFKRFSS